VTAYQQPPIMCHTRVVINAETANNDATTRQS
jgi:hypothetical protein